MRQTDGEKGSKVWTLYKCEKDKDPMKIRSDEESTLLGDKRKFFIAKSDKENILVQVKPTAVELL